MIPLPDGQKIKRVKCLLVEPGPITYFSKLLCSPNGGKRHKDSTSAAGRRHVWWRERGLALHKCIMFIGRTRDV